MTGTSSTSTTPSASHWQRWGWPVVGTTAIVVLVAACAAAGSDGGPSTTASSPPIVAGSSPAPAASTSIPSDTSGDGSDAGESDAPLGGQPVATEDLTGAMLVADDQLGGAVTAYAVTQNAFGLPAPGLTTDERRTFEVGDSFFTQPWVQAPASTVARDGLGPAFNANACAACHVRDGRAEPPSADHDGPGLLVRTSRIDADGAVVDDPVFGGQVQDRALPGLPVEGMVILSHEPVTGTYDDGTPWELSAPIVTLVGPDGAPVDDPDLLLSPRIAPQMIGMGLLEAIPYADVRAAADPDDADGDGISGRVNEVESASTGEVELGRIGWKANVATVADQVAGAFLGDIGITSPLAPDDTTGDPTVDAAAAAFDGSDESGFEIDDDRVDAVVAYTQSLAVPAQRDIDDPRVARGADMFLQANCASCHTPMQRTGSSPIGALVDQPIRPFTDLLLHDMGPGLADGRPDGLATGSEWRTPPLWGIGLVESINGHTRFLHDGRARSLEEAVLWHGGEAEASRDAFVHMSADDRAALLAFLGSL